LKYGVVHISTGDLLRAAVEKKTELGLSVKEYMDAGNLVPDKLMINLIVNRLRHGDCQHRGWLLDGYPRTHEQAKALKEAGIVPEHFILITVPDQILIERVVGRRNDPVTGLIYHTKFNPPKEEEVAKRLVQRSDDTEDKVKIRIAAFHQHNKSILDDYKGVLVTVNGNQDKNTVFDAICAAIDK